MKALLHIGIPKTATTTIQSFLSANHHSLLDKGYIVTTSAGVENNLYLAVAAYDVSRRDELTRLNNISSDEQLRSLQQRIVTNLKEEIRGYKTEFQNPQRVIFSSEYFHMLLRTPEELHRLKTVLHCIGFNEVEVIAYLRKPADLANSYFSTSVKSGVTNSFPQPPEQPRYEHLCNHKNTLLRFSEVFGKTNINVRIFERSEFVNGSIIDDFLQAVGIQDNKSFTTPEPMNESLSAEGIDIQGYLNRIFPRWIGDELNPLLPGLIKHLTQQFTGKGAAMPTALKHKYDEYFKTSDEWVCEQYFPNRKNLFNSKTNDESQVVKSENRINNSLKIQAHKIALDYLNKVSTTPMSCLIASSEQIPAPYGYNTFEVEHHLFQRLVNLSVGISQHHLGNYKNAIDLFNLVLASDSHNLEALIFRAMSLAELDDAKTADDEYLKLLQLQPENFRVQRLYALNAEKQGLSKAAESRWNNILHNNPDNAEALLKTGICKLKAEKYSAALACFNKLLSSNTNDTALYFKCRCLIEMTETDQAENLLEKSVSRMGASVALYTLYANLAEARQDWAAAASRWDQAIKVFPDEVELQQKGNLCHNRLAKQA